MGIPEPQGEAVFASEFVKKMVKKYHSEMLKTTFPTATWEYGNGSIQIWVTFPEPHDSLDEYKKPLLQCTDI
jgi:DNA-binding transcriptional MocR family regulator